MHIKKHLAALFLVPIVAVLSPVLLPAASAAPTSAPVDVTCWGDYCSGQDPAGTGCANDAYTVASFNDDYMSLQVRWSPTCQTNWARLVVYATNCCFTYGSLYARQSTGYEQSTTTPLSTGGTYWTPMIYSPSHCVKAIFYPQFKTWNKVETTCV